MGTLSKPQKKQRLNWIRSPKAFGFRGAFFSLLILQQPVVFPPLPGADTVDALESPGEMQGIGIAYLDADILDVQPGGFQEVLGFTHAVVHQEGLGRLAHGFPEDLAEVGTVQADAVGNVFNGYFILIVMFNKCQGLLHIKVPELAVIAVPAAAGGGGQLVEEQETLADEKDGVSLAVFHNEQHLLL